VLLGRAIPTCKSWVGVLRCVSEYIVQYASRLVRATRPKDASAPQFVRELVDGARVRARANS